MYPSESFPNESTKLLSSREMLSITTFDLKGSLNSSYPLFYVLNV